MTAEQALARMIERFDHGKHWAPCHSADAEGNPIRPWSGPAQRWCVVAMASQVTGGPRLAGTLLDEVQERIARAAGLERTREIPQWNDSRESFGEVEVVLRAAIEDGK